MKNKEPLAPKKFGRSKTILAESDTFLVLEIYKEQNFGARRLERVIKHKSAVHVDKGPAFLPCSQAVGLGRGSALLTTCWLRICGIYQENAARRYSRRSNCSQALFSYGTIIFKRNTPQLAAAGIKCMRIQLRFVSA
jgi:hypothetical protein